MAYIIVFVLPHVPQDMSSLRNLLSLPGIQIAITFVLRARHGGLLWLATPCKSWVNLNRGWAIRSVLAPAGPSASHTSPAQQAYLTEHNGIAKLSSYLAWTAHLMGLHVVIEQPVSSLLFSYAPISRLIHGIKATSVSFGMSTFEGSTPKPLLLKGGRAVLANLRCGLEATTQDSEDAPGAFGDSWQETR